MKTDEWEERYRGDDYDPRTYPSPALAACVDWLPDGRALDVACGVGRNAVFLAERGYEVDGVDVAQAALDRGADRAAERGVDVNWIRADVHEFALDLDPDAYDLIAVSYFVSLDRLADLKEALAPGGALVYEHHLRSTDPVDRGPSTDRYRLRANDLLRACLDLTVVRYEEATREIDGRTAAVATLVARNDRAGSQSYPPTEWPETATDGDGDEDESG